MSKGSKQRPTDLKKYGKNWDNVFNDSQEQVDVKINDQGAIEIKNTSGEQTKERKIRVVKEYTDQNGIEMVIVNVDDALSNRTMTKSKLRALQHEIINQEPQVLQALEDIKNNVEPK